MLFKTISASKVPNKVLYLLITFSLVSLILSGCTFRGKLYHNPPATGVVLDAQSFEPVTGATVWFREGYPMTTTDESGHFTLPSHYETQFFRLMLPGSSFEYVPVHASHDELGNGIAWARQFLNSNSEADTAPLVIYVFPSDRPLITDAGTCELNPQDQATYNLLSWLDAHLGTESLEVARNLYPAEHAYLSDTLLNQVYSIERACDFRYTISEALFEQIDGMRYTPQ
ncbi:MAG: hypothetical protein JJU10_03905 [Idiomarina sp.]|nr:hypothetical protein [Idiomarina sp.]